MLTQSSISCINYSCFLSPHYNHKTCKMKLARICWSDSKSNLIVFLKVFQTSAWITLLRALLGLALVNFYKRLRRSGSSATVKVLNPAIRLCTLPVRSICSTLGTSTFWKRQRHSATIWLLDFTRIQPLTSTRDQTIRLWTWTSAFWVSWLAR